MDKTFDVWMYSPDILKDEPVKWWTDGLVDSWLKGWAD